MVAGIPFEADWNRISRTNSAGYVAGQTPPQFLTRLAERQPGGQVGHGGVRQLNKVRLRVRLAR
jgi:hypothetical protein